MLPWLDQLLIEEEEDHEELLDELVAELYLRLALPVVWRWGEGPTAARVRDFVMCVLGLRRSE
jgi:hypothetical protein